MYVDIPSSSEILTLVFCIAPKTILLMIESSILNWALKNSTSSSRVSDKIVKFKILIIRYQYNAVNVRYLYHWSCRGEVICSSERALSLVKSQSSYGCLFIQLKAWGSDNYYLFFINTHTPVKSSTCMHIGWVGYRNYLSLDYYLHATIIILYVSIYQLFLFQVKSILQ